MLLRKRPLDHGAPPFATSPPILPLASTCSTSSPLTSPSSSPCLVRRQPREPRGRPGHGNKKEKAKAALAKSRQADMEKALHLGVLQTASIRPATQKRYVKLYTEFLTWLGRRSRLIVGDVEALDCLLQQYLEECYLEGEALSWAQTMVAAALYFAPQVGRGIQKQLPRTAQALRGFRLKNPPRARLPWPWELVALLANGLILRSQTECALALLLMFELYLRPGETFLIRAVDLVARAGTGRFRAYDVILNPFEAEAASKTNEFDSALSLDLPRHAALGPALESMIGRRLGARWRPAERQVAANAPKQARRLFEVTQAQVTAGVKLVLKEVGVDMGVAHLYRARHGGASFDFSTKARTLEEVRRRGRWKCHASLRRYEKGSRLAQLLENLDDGTRRHAELCAKHIYDVVAGKRSPYPDP